MRAGLSPLTRVLAAGSFTALSETLKKQHAKRGSELLNVYINAYFEKLIEEVTKFHGDVIKFAGDALQVVWRAPVSGSTLGSHNDAFPERQGLPGYVLRASQCCLHLLQVRGSPVPAPAHAGPSSSI